MNIRRAAARILPVALVAGVGLAIMPSSPAQAKGDFSARPFMGFSTWSVESSPHDGGMSWLTESNVKKSADAIATNLKSAGYSYINLDSGWNNGVDGNGIPKVDSGKFPDGMKATFDYIHSKGLKAGIYDVVGLPGAAYDANTPIQGTSCHARDIAKPGPVQVPNGWPGGTDYEVDYTNSCTQAYFNSVVNAFASWGADFIKVDGQHFNDGSVSSSDVPVDNLAVWSRAIDQQSRQIYLTASGWPVPLSEADGLKPYANGVRIDTDVECYCDTVSSWDSSVKARFQELPDWISHVGPNYWADLDSMPINNNTGTGIQDGINDTERQTVMNFWSMASAPLYVGGDVQNMDSKAISILSNPEVVAVDQSGVIPREVKSGSQQVWTKQLGDGSTVVGIYNTDSGSANVTVNFSDLGLSGSAAVRDLAARSDLGNASGSWTASNIPGHGSRLIKLSGATGGTTGGTGGTTPPPTSPPPTTPPANSGAIKGVQSGKCVDVNGSNTGDGATVTLYSCNGQANQTWASSGGTLRSLGKCLDITGGGTANNTYVELWSCNGGANQQWAVNADGTIRNPASGRCLDAAGSGTANGTRLIIWDCNGQSNQKWTYGS